MQSARADAFETLFAQEYPRLVTVASRILDRADAEDAAQEAFAAWCRLGSAIPPERARGWLQKAAVHRALDVLRSRRRRDERELRASETALAPDPLDSVERSETRQAVRTVLGRLRPEYAAILALRYGGCTYREIAEALDINAGSVGTMLARAESAFKKEYDRVSSR